MPLDSKILLSSQVQNNLCTPKNGEILVASTQDFLTTSFLVTRKDTFYDRAAFCLMCSYMGDGMEHIDLPTPAVIKVGCVGQPSNYVVLNYSVLFGIFSLFILNG